MNRIVVRTVGDLLGSFHYAEIVNPLDGNVVRRLHRRAGNMVEIDAITSSVMVAADCAVTYQPWVFDRGNLLFACSLSPRAKLCTELDTLRRSDGEHNITHAEGL